MTTASCYTSDSWELSARSSSLLRRRGHFASLAASAEEWFADWFARELVLPRRWTRQPWNEAQLAAWHVSYDTVALQLAVVNEAPELMRNGRRVLCRECGTTRHRRGCACVPWREQYPGVSRVPPDVRNVLARNVKRPSNNGIEQLEMYALMTEAEDRPSKRDVSHDDAGRRGHRSTRHNLMRWRHVLLGPALVP
jgi:hypothetical protein